MSGFPLPPIVAELVVQVVGAAVGAFLRTTLGMAALGIAAAIGSFWYAFDAGAWQGALAAVASVAICAGSGLLLASKRAALRGVRELVTSHRAGGRVVEAIFDRLAALPGVSVVGRIPLAEAERRLRSVVDVIDGDGFLRRRIAARLVELVRSVTLARFRHAEAHEGGVDLALVRADLAGRADDLVADHVSALERRLTFVIVAVAVILCCAAALAIGRL